MVGISVDFEKIASGEGVAGNVGRCHLVDFDTARVHLHLVAKLIVAFVFAVKHYVDRAAIWRIFKSA